MAFIILAGLVACAHDRGRLEGSELRRRNPKTLLLYLEPNEQFDAHRASGLAFMILPVSTFLGTLADGERFARERTIEDPAARVGEALAGALSRSYGLDRVTVTQDSPAGAVVPVQRHPRVGADLILDVRTTRWGIAFARSQRLGRYAAHLEMEALLTDTRDGKVLARGTCVGDDPRTSDGRRYDELTANDAAVVKHDLAWAADRCDRIFRTKVLSVPLDEHAPGGR
jgi:hypothetical protein